jgi:SAM-dependent methyltransferase
LRNCRQLYLATATHQNRKIIQMSDIMVDALRAIRDGNLERGRQLAAQATDSVLGQCLESFLIAHTDVRGSVYTDPAAFQAFIAGGGNLGLYDSTATELAAVYDRCDARSVLDLGCGDGAALVPAATRAARTPERVDLVEISAALLAKATETLHGLDLNVLPHETTAQDFIRSLDRSQQWDVAQSTFALHTIPVGERDDVLRKLRRHVAQLAIIEFDIPPLEPGTEQHLRFLADTYERGLGEYTADRELVANGFLIPVLIGQLAPHAARMTYEQSAIDWAAQVATCGWTEITTTALYPYWSSPAFLLTAKGEGQEP